VMIWQRRFAAIFFATIALLLLVFLVGGNLEPKPPEATNVASWYVFMMTGPPVRFFEFLFGIGLGLLYLKHKEFRLPTWTWSLMEVLAVAGIAAYATTIDSFLNRVGPALGPVFSQWYRHNGGFLVFGFAIVCFAYRGGLLSRFLSLPLLVLLGEISFSTYMIHQLIVRLWEGMGWLSTEWNPLGLATILTVIYVGSYVSWRFFELPAQRAILTLGRRRSELART
jgi:peptidoglycan/LPS O-acetylase OafA/YrhL